jgi:signal transduction histidine kinase
VPATPSPSADPATAGQGSKPRRSRRVLPRTFQTRLTLAFVGVTALVVSLISIAVVVRLDAYFQEQDQQYIGSRVQSVAAVVTNLISQSSGDEPVVDAANTVNPLVVRALGPGIMSTLADKVALADVSVRIGSPDPEDASSMIVATNGVFTGTLDPGVASAGQTQQPGRHETHGTTTNSARYVYALEVELIDPLTFRATTIANLTGLLLVLSVLGLALAVLVAAFLASRFATPLRRLALAAKRVGEGDLSSRVPLAEATAGSAEIGEVSHQFNAMADRLEESIEFIRQDRDRSREFLADVSHELRTPITSMRTFLELLQGPAGSDAEHRQEFLASSLSQLGRLDWMAENLLELSKLDSGLVALDLRPEDLRGTVESAVEQTSTNAQRRGIRVTLELSDRPLRVWHDPLRIGQVVSNLVGNAIKFTPRGGEVRVGAQAIDDGARITVRDSGIGIAADELPHIFDRFYRGVGAAEARSEGSGLGLAIVKSIVDMHGGRISVESRVGRGTTFEVDLPRDGKSAPAARGAAGQATAVGHSDEGPLDATDGAGPTGAEGAADGQVVKPSPNGATEVNPQASR